MPAARCEAKVEGQGSGPFAALRELGASLGTSLLVAAGTATASAASLLPAGFLSAACWALVCAGVAGTFLAGRGSRWGWLLLVGLQPLWISYALSTEQYGFVVGALAYGGAQVNGFLRSRAGLSPSGGTRPR